MRVLELSSLFMKMENFIFRNEYSVQVEHPVTEMQKVLILLKSNSG